MLKITLEIDSTLAERCRDLAIWRDTGSLPEGSALSAQAAEHTEQGIRMGMAYAEYKTQTEAIEAIAAAFRLATMPIS